MDELRGEVPEELRHAFEFLSFRHPDVPNMLGKGHAEYLAIKHTVENSDSVREHCSHVVKVTGRYAIKNFVRGLADYDTAETDVVLQSSTPTWQILDGVVRSEVVGFRKELVDFLFAGQDESRGLPMEYVLRKKAEEFSKKGGGNVTFWKQLDIYNSGNVLDGNGRIITHL